MRMEGERRERKEERKELKGFQGGNKIVICSNFFFGRGGKWGSGDGAC